VAGWPVLSRIRLAGDAAGQAQAGGGCGGGRQRDWDGEGEREGADESERERRRERKKGGEAGKEDRKPPYIFGGLAPKQKPDSSNGKHGKEKKQAQNPLLGKSVSSNGGHPMEDPMDEGIAGDVATLRGGQSNLL